MVWLPPTLNYVVRADIVTVYGDLKLPGRAVTITARKLVCATSQCTIDTSGGDGKDYSAGNPAAKGRYTPSQPGGNGADGAPGGDGGDGGDITIGVGFLHNVFRCG